jgi:hypothetical protein
MWLVDGIWLVGGTPTRWFFYGIALTTYVKIRTTEKYGLFYPAAGASVIGYLLAFRKKFLCRRRHLSYKRMRCYFLFIKGKL